MNKVCKITSMPQYAIQTVYEQWGIRFLQDKGTWDILLPSFDIGLNKRMTGYTGLHGKWVEYVCGTDVFVSRVTLWNYLKTYAGWDNAALIVPETFILEEADDIQRLKQSSADEVFILKGTAHRRKGIKIVIGFEQLMAHKKDYVVAQKFIFDQLRYNNTTFHLRGYMLLTLKEGVLSAHIYEDAICVYAKPDAEATDIFERWVTHPDNPVPDNYPCSLFELCEKSDYNFENIWWDIAARLIGIVSTTASNFGLIQNLKNSNCYQNFGFDVIMKNDFSPLICEINKDPEMAAKNSRYAAIKNTVIKDVLTVAGILAEKNHGFIHVLEIDLNDRSSLN
jgi:hypothetical protein